MLSRVTIEAALPTNAKMPLKRASFHFFAVPVWRYILNLNGMENSNGNINLLIKWGASGPVFVMVFPVHICSLRTIIIVPNHHYHQLENLYTVHNWNCFFFFLILFCSAWLSSIFPLYFSYPLGWLFSTNLTAQMWRNQKESTKLYTCNCVPTRRTRITFAVNFLQDLHTSKNLRNCFGHFEFCARASVHIKIAQNACIQDNGSKLQIHLIVIVVHIQDSLNRFVESGEQQKKCKTFAICLIRVISQTNCKWHWQRRRRNVKCARFTE